MSDIGIIGHGFVGKAIEHGFKHPDDVGHTVRIYDKFKNIDTLEDVIDNSEVIFVCLPTPFNEDTLEIDLSIYDEMIDEICPMIPKDSGKILVIKSTVVPGTTSKYADKYPDVFFAFNPEFLTEANYLMDFVNPDRIVVGSSNDWVSQTIIMLYRSMPHFVETPILTMSATAAEMVKYQCNVMLASKVAVANVFYDLCTSLDVRYSDVQRGAGMDSRIGKTHMDVTTERGFGGKCFPKDLGAFIGRCNEMGVDCDILEKIFEYNSRIRKVKDWQEIAGATVGGRKYTDNDE